MMTNNMETDVSTIDRYSEIILSSSSILSQKILGIDYVKEPDEAYRQMYLDCRGISEKYEIPLCLDIERDYKNWVESLQDLADCRGAKIVFNDDSSLNPPLYFPKSKRIVMSPIDLVNCTEWEAFVWGCNLSHELVHHMQMKLAPSMPIEQKEYEAYVVSSLPLAVNYAISKAASSEKWERYVAVEYIFDRIKTSLRSYYQRAGKDPDQISWVQE